MPRGRGGAPPDHRFVPSCGYRQGAFGGADAAKRPNDGVPDWTEQGPAAISRAKTRRPLRTALQAHGLKAMKDWLLQIFTWWNGQTIGTRFHTWRFGEKVGEDEFGNVYYRTKGGVKDKALGFQRRWVIYRGEAEASKVPPGWNGWLHHTVDVAPSEESYQPREWQQPHEQNWTGTALAYRPQGSTLAEGERPAATGDYQAWTPGR